MKLNIDIDKAAETRGSCSGTIAHLYLIPPDESGGGDDEADIYVWSNVGSGVPEPAYHRRWLSLGPVNTEFVAASLVAVLRDQAETLCQMADCYSGSEWDGHNHVGRWRDQDLLQDLKYGLSLECATYCSASDWFTEVGSDLLAEIKNADDLDDWAEGIVETAAADCEVILDAEDVRDWADEQLLDVTNARN